MKIYKFPNEYEKKSTQYQVCCDDQPIDVYSCDVSAVPFNQVWPGYQRPKNQTEESAYVMFSSNDSVSLEIEPKGSFNKVTVRPLSKNIQTDIIGGKVSHLGTYIFWHCFINNKTDMAQENGGAIRRSLSLVPLGVGINPQFYWGRIKKL